MIEDDDLSEDIGGLNVPIPRDSFKLTNRSGFLFEKTKRMPYRKVIHSNTESEQSIKKRENDELYGKAMEEKFQAICEAIIKEKTLHWLVSCKHAPKNEDIRHRTDFKLRAIHPDGYEFFLRVQVKSSRRYLSKYADRPLQDDGIVLLIIYDNIKINLVANILNSAFKKAIKKEQQRV